ncbi:MAG: hypothetical protein DCC67_12630 [Planctomycetota bacterium]|nr:MAG: hypothetical protein DCC67_12630 [Planctomycetota bacterium]
MTIRGDENQFEFATDADDSAGSSTPGGVSAVANASPKPALAIIADDAVVPAATTRPSNSLRNSPSRGWLGGGPRRPSATAGIRPTGRSARSEAAATAKSPTARPKATVPAMPSAAQTPAPRPPVAPMSEAATQAPADAAARPFGAANALLVQAYQLSLKAASEGEYSQIVRWCAEAMRLGLNAENRQFCLQLSAWALNRRGQVRAAQGQDALALADFRAAIDFDPNCWRALHNRGVTLAQTGQFAEAFDDMSRVIQLNPQYAKAYSNRATLYVQAGDLDRAVADYETAINLEPELVPALVGHARVCHMAGRLEQALASFARAIKLQDGSAEIICSRADLLVDLGQYGDALHDYARAIDIDSKFEHAYRNGAWLLATCPDDDVRDAEAALKGAQAALDCGYGDRHAALDTMAAALANAGRFDEAVSTIQQAIEVAPEDARPAYQARLELYQAGRPYRTHPILQQGDVQTADFVEVDG